MNIPGPAKGDIKHELLWREKLCEVAALRSYRVTCRRRTPVGHVDTRSRSCRCDRRRNIRPLINNDSICAPNDNNSVRTHTPEPHAITAALFV